jgi:hypothetical protein
MKRPEHVPAFSKALLAGALTGLAATVANIVYDIIFRSITRYMPAMEFNFFSITLASMIVLTLIGMVFFLFTRYFNYKAFIVTLIIVIIACILITAFLHSDARQPAFYGNHGLIAGFVIISGLLSLTLLPYLFRHPKIFI